MKWVIWFLPAALLFVAGAVAQQRAIELDQAGRSTLIDGLWALGLGGGGIVWLILIGLIVIVSSINEKAPTESKDQGIQDEGP
ncbi:MAG: hypothetical protein AAFR33_01685 [Pseudomonadota bacterium]